MAELHACYPNTMKGRVKKSMLLLPLISADLFFFLMHTQDFAMLAGMQLHYIGLL